MKILLNNSLKYLFILWVFFIPYQIFLTSGVSISLAIVLLILSLLLLLVKYATEGNITLKIIFLLKKYFLVLLLLSSIAISYLFNLDLSNAKELLRWVLFGFEVILVLEILRLKIVSKETLLITALISMLTMIALTSYQLFITPYEELNIVRNISGSIFNDPDFIKERFDGVGKFNWLYGNSLRVHGVFANVSHFAFILGAIFLLILSNTSKLVEKYRVAILTLFAAFIILSLVRSIFLSLGLILIIYIIFTWGKENRSKTIKQFLLSLVFGGLLAILLATFSANHLIFWSLIVRTLETISFDGALFTKSLASLTSFFQTVNISSGEFNEYGGVGGRVNLLKITVQEVIVPNLLNVKFLLFGFGPASLGNLLKNTSDAYFSAFNTVDNSHLQWIVEIGLLPFVAVLVWVRKSWKLLLIVFPKYWMVIFYILINAFFFNLLPDIRMAMFTALLIGIIFGDE